MIRAFIFDFDGTLMDTEILWVKAVEQYLCDQGKKISYDDAVSIVYGKSWLDVYDRIVSVSSQTDVSVAQMELDLRKRMLALRNGQNAAIPGSVELLKHLSVEYPVCIVSGAPSADLKAAVDELQIWDNLDFILAAEDYGRGKPDPGCFLMAADKLGVSPSECLVFEDSAAGINGAKRAGMTAVALVRPGLPEQDVSNADLVLSNLSDFSLKNINCNYNRSEDV